jgi:hypothetical protein
MNHAISATIASFLLLGTTAAWAQSGTVRNLNGIWVSVNPPGPHITCSTVAGRTTECSLPMGQASVRVSDGVAGSNLRVSGEGFDCYYFLGWINQCEMTWEFKKGDGVCMRSAHYKKDPPL